MCVPTRTYVHMHEVMYMWVVFASHVYTTIYSYFVSVLQILGRIFPRDFPCRIGLQTTQSVEESIEDLTSAEIIIKEPVTSECHE